MELITTPFIILCALVSIAFFIGMKVGEDNQKNKVDKLNDGTWKLAKKIVSRRYTQEKLDE